jgi:CHASE3 domain sensor protein
VAPGLRAVAGAVVRPPLRLWERVPLRVQGRITVGLPLVAVVISACLAISGNTARIGLETDIQQEFETSAALGGITSLMVDAETGVRGYLLTRDVTYLEPFDRAARELPAAMQHLMTLVAAEPVEGPRAETLGRLRDLQGLTARQIADLAFQRDLVAAGGDPTGAEIRAHLGYGKELTDGIRAEVGALQARERELLDGRLADINAIRLRDYVSVAVALVAALAMRFLAWYLFRRGVLRRVERLTGNLRGLRLGAPLPCPPPTKADQMGELEREVHLLHDPEVSRPGPTP